MKKIFLYALFLCCSIACVQAQGKQSLGLQVGFTQPITRLNSPVPGKETTLNPTTYNGLKVGVIYDATIVAGFGYAIGSSLCNESCPSSCKSTIFSITGCRSFLMNIKRLRIMTLYAPRCRLNG